MSGREASLAQESADAWSNLLVCRQRPLSKLENRLRSGPSGNEPSYPLLLQHGQSARGDCSAELFQAEALPRHRSPQGNTWPTRGETRDGKETMSAEEAAAASRATKGNKSRERRRRLRMRSVSRTRHRRSTGLTNTQTRSTMCVRWCRQTCHASLSRRRGASRDRVRARILVWPPRRPRLVTGGQVSELLRLRRRFFVLKTNSGRRHFPQCTDSARHSEHRWHSRNHATRHATARHE